MVTHTSAVASPVPLLSEKEAAKIIGLFVRTLQTVLVSLLWTGFALWQMPDFDILYQYQRATYELLKTVEGKVQDFLRCTLEAAEKAGDRLLPDDLCVLVVGTKFTYEKDLTIFTIMP